ncbi:DUF4380 domain-containing protein [Aestuariicella hydrocarbonica]|uniref:DUF4380 domain-containing protein n=1 Tax=Pseudomaricurvus hydrocarbonicus TaxID=1470433 RepID=A0A9E5JXK7_9GAMM|nr:DUF4380 domain-containing protein [Aestuariicella hydrocarbonica]NHO66446.1 DUF4380 domain-containing protein [Aestuariicella hydrocarbonica]
MSENTQRLSVVCDRSAFSMFRYWLRVTVCIGMIQCASADSEARQGEGSAVLLGTSQRSITVEPETGGRISSFKVAGREFLYGKSAATAGSNNWGSTFWVSPQSLWNWPPVPEHDSLPYGIRQLQARSLSLVGRPGLGVQLSKEIELPSGDQHRVKLTYRLQAAKHFSEIAAWEVTRVRRRGLVLFPARASSLAIPMGDVSYQASDKVVWIDLDSQDKPPEGKLTANGVEGWLAWIDRGVVFMKRYPRVDADRVATGEGDVEVYLSGQQEYMELEVQSAAQTLAEGDSLSWEVHWLVADVPEGLRVEVGNAELVNWLRTLR